MNFLPKDRNGCPWLILAPMEGVGDRCFRKSMASVGGFDEAVTDFIRVPSCAHVESLARVYDAAETFPIPLAAQIMGGDSELMADMAREIEARNAPRIDLNCGCPSNTVTGRGAGSSLLKEPDLLHEVAKSIVQAVSVPVTVKMRSGFEDISLFKENLLAAQESGIAFLTLHPRTKVDGYGPPARWDLIAEAKSILKIPLVGNGDILKVEDALKMLRETRCDALMIGRGAIMDPFIFKRIRAHFARQEYIPTWEDRVAFYDVYLKEIPEEMPLRNKLGKVKQLMSFLFKASPELLKHRQTVLSNQSPDPRSFLGFALNLFKNSFTAI